MGDDADAKWHRALLKKLRSAVAVKTRVDAGDAASLQKSQAGKGTKRAIDDALRALKQAGLGRDSPLVRAAFEAGAREGTTAMEKAAKRGPDGGADGLTPSKKRLKREARAEAYAEGGGGGEADASGKKASFRSGGLALGASSSKTTTPRNPHVSGHVFAACKRAVYALHALAKEPEREGAAYVFSLQKRFLSATASLSSPASLVAAADARLAGIAVVAREGQPAGDRRERASIALPPRRRKRRRRVSAAPSRSGSPPSRPRTRAARRRRRGPPQASARRRPRAWTERRGARRGKGAAQTRRAGGLGQPAGCRQRAVGVRACASLVDAEAAKRLVAALAGGGNDERILRRRRNPREMSGALWALATLHGDGSCPDAAAIAAALASAAGAAARDAGTSRRGASGTRLGRAGNCFSERRETRLRGAFAKRTSPRCRRWRRRRASWRRTRRVVPAEKPGEHALRARRRASTARSRSRSRRRSSPPPPPRARRRRAREAFPPNKKRRSLRNRVARVARARRRALRRAPRLL